MPFVICHDQNLHISWSFDGLNAPYVKSTDGGLSFETLRELVLPDSTKQPIAKTMLIDGKNKVYMVCETYFNDAQAIKNFILSSTDEGESWSNPLYLPDSITPHGDPIWRWFSGVASGDTIIFAITRGFVPYHDLLISTNGGATWTTKRIQGTPYNGQMALLGSTLHLVNNVSLDLVGFHSPQAVQYQKSTDLGETWSPPLPITTLSNFQTYEPFVTASEEKLVVSWRDRRSACSGDVDCMINERQLNLINSTWSNEITLTGELGGSLNRNTFHNNLIAVAWIREYDLGMDYRLVMRVSSDNGITWGTEFLITPEPSYVGNFIVTMNGNTIHVVWSSILQSRRNQIMYQRGIINPTLVHEKTGADMDFHLETNYPNPFNPSTLINYYLPKGTTVKIEVYTILGQKISTLINEYQNSGSKSVRFEADPTVPSGVYLYKIITDSHTQVKKMLLLR